MKNIINLSSAKLAQGVVKIISAGAYIVTGLLKSSDADESAFRQYFRKKKNIKKTRLYNFDPLKPHF